MLNKSEINILRKKLDDSILNNEDYSVIYKLSTDLDKLIAKYYRECNYSKEKLRKILS